MNDLKALHAPFALRHYELQRAGCRVCLPRTLEQANQAFSDVLYHCIHCNKKIYLCEADEQIKFYSSFKLCIAVPRIEAGLIVERNTPSSIPSTRNGAELAKPNDNGMSSVDRSDLNVWWRPQQSDQVTEIQPSDMPAPLHHPQKAEDPGIPVFLRKRQPKEITD